MLYCVKILFLMINLGMKTTLASLPEVSVSCSPFSGAEFSVPPQKEPRIQRVYELMAEFIVAPIVDAAFDHPDQRKAFWREYEELLDPAEQYLVRRNPLKWGVVDGIASMLSLFAKDDRFVIKRWEYEGYTLDERISYVDQVRQACLDLMQR
jgi:hypothetical protein